MFDKSLGKGLVSVSVAALVALSISALAAENATITRDGVEVHEQPAVWERTWGTLANGTRVEAAVRIRFHRHGRWIYRALVSH